MLNICIPFTYFSDILSKHSSFRRFILPNILKNVWINVEIYFIYFFDIQLKTVVKTFSTIFFDY